MRWNSAPAPIGIALGLRIPDLGPCLPPDHATDSRPGAKFGLLAHSPQQTIIRLVRADPDPVKIIVKTPRNRSIAAPNGDCPDFSLGLKLERGVKRVGLEKPVFLPRLFLNFRRQVSEEFAEAGSEV